MKLGLLSAIVVLDSIVTKVLDQTINFEKVCQIIFFVHIINLLILNQNHSKSTL